MNLTQTIQHFMRATVCFLALLLGAGCVSGRFTTYAIPMKITGTVEDAANGEPLDDVALTFASEAILHPTESTVGMATSGKIDLEYLLGFCRKERMRDGKWEDPGDKFQIVVSREGYVPAVFDFALNEIGEETPYVVGLGKVALWRE
jgi:hypothetical protein